MNRFTDVSIAQVLHGYKNGHVELASSTSLPASARKQLSALSDATSSARQKSFEEYYTGYPVDGTDYYAFAKTWYADEMPRPGCVWTHTLLIPIGVENLPDVLELKKLFVRPGDSQDFKGYEKDLEIKATYSREELRTPLIGLESSFENKSFEVHLLELLLGFDEYAVAIASNDNKKHEDLILRVWQSVWKIANRWFSFCTGALAPRYIGKRIFDLQTLYRRTALDASKSSGAVLLFDGETEQFQSNSRSAVVRSVPISFLMKEFSSPFYFKIKESFGSKFSKRNEFSAALFLLRLVNGFAPIGPISFMDYMESWKRWDSSIKKALLEGLVEALPELEEIMSSVVDDFVIQVICEKTKDGSLDGPLLEKLVEQYWPSLNSRIARMVLIISKVEAGPSAADFLDAVASKVSEKEIGDLTNSSPQLLPILTEHRPELALFEKTWETSEEENHAMWLVLQGKKNLGADFYRRLFNIFIDLRIDSLGNDIERKKLGKLAVECAMETLDSHRYENIKGCRWKDFLVRNRRDVFSWASAAKSLNYFQTVVILNLLLEFPYEKIDLETQTQKKMLDLFSMNQDQNERSLIASCLLMAALENRVPEPARTLAFVFADVHQFAADSNDYFPGWHLLAPICPPRKKKRDWDKCERLRIALIRSSLDLGVDIRNLLSGFHHNELIRLLADTASKIDGAKKFEDVAKSMR